MKIRLHQFLSKCGVFSSKNEIKKAIWDGKISLNGSIVKNISFEFNPEKKKVVYEGEELLLPQNDKYFLEPHRGNDLSIWSMRFFCTMRNRSLIF